MDKPDIIPDVPDPIVARPNPYPVDRPTEVLTLDHDMVRKLADTYLNSQDMLVKHEAAKQIIPAVHVHSRLEETVFYPRVRHVDPEMIRRFEQEHLKVDDQLAALQGMPLDAPQADRLILELIDMVLAHIQEEENDFFPKLQNASIDLTSIGVEMLNFETSLVHQQVVADATAATRK
jgi:hemerythrin superfamily protein